MTSSLPGSIPSHLVGRDRELGVLRDHLTAAVNGRGSLVLIGGEAGIGKTALAEVVCQEASERGALVLVGRSFDFTETPPYGPWVEAIGRYRQTDGLPPLPAAFTQRGIIGPVTSQAALFQQIADFLGALTVAHPVVLLLDDLHWADPASLDLLRVTARATASLPLLLLTTYRADELTRRHPLYALLPVLVREANATRLALHPLEEEATAALARGRFTLPDADNTRLVAYLDARGEGNPFFIGELLQTLVEERVLRERDGGWTLGDLAGASVPPLLRQVIDGRLERLDAEIQRLLAVAAVIGQEVPLAVWTTVAQVDEDAIAEVIERGVAARLLAETAAGARFAHALVREAVYEGISAMRRRRLHLRVAERLLAMPTPDPDAMGYHLQQAGDARAAEWLTRAGERAALAYAWAVAADRYAAALALLPTTDATAGERGWLRYRLAWMRGFDDGPQAVEHLLEAERLGRVAGDAGLVALSIFARGLCRCIADTIQAGLEDVAAGVAARRALSSAERARLRAPSLSLGSMDETDGAGPFVQWLATAGRYAQARAIGEDAMAARPPSLAGEGGFAARGDVSLGLAQVYAALGLPDESAQAFAAARAAFTAIGFHFMVGMCDANETRLTLCYIADRPAALRRLASAEEQALARGYVDATEPRRRAAWFPLLVLHGRWEDAREVALAARAEHGLPYTSVIRHHFGAMAYARGERDLVDAIVDEVFPRGPETEPGDTFLLGALVLQRVAAACALDEGDVGRAQAWLTAHTDWLAWSGAVTGIAEGHFAWAGYCRAVGDREAAYEHATQGLARATTPRQPLALLAAHRVLGQLDGDAGRYVSAGKHLDASLALAAACQAPYERAQSLLVMAEMHAVVGERDAARTALDEACAICERLGAQPLLVRIRGQGGREDGRNHARQAYTAGLTAREVEVLRLMTAGRTNREIADALFLSPATVSIHVTHILAKTGTANRTEATAFALRHGLA
jgi:DNA-binding CsgD family transcriptional regulator